MERNIDLMIDILEQFKLAETYETDNPYLAEHIALLKDRDYIEAEIIADGFGRPKSAKIHRITAKGYDDLEVSLRGRGVVGYALDDEDKDELKRAKDGQIEAERLFDKVLYFLSSGGIVAVLMMAAKLLELNKPIVSYCWLFYAVIIFCVTLISSLVSHYCSSRAFDRFIGAIYDGNRCTGWNNGWSIVVKILNAVNIVLLLLGGVFFLVFLRTNLHY